MFVFLALGFLAPLAWSASFCDPSSGWKTNWVDEFEGDTLNASSWSVVSGSNSGTCRDALCIPDNVQVSNGKLILTSKRESQGIFYAVFVKLLWGSFCTLRYLESSVFLSKERRKETRSVASSAHPSPQCPCFIFVIFSTQAALSTLRALCGPQRNSTGQTRPRFACVCRPSYLAVAGMELARASGLHTGSCRMMIHVGQMKVRRHPLRDLVKLGAPRVFIDIVCPDLFLVQAKLISWK
jgi:hypothetical protein